MEINKNLIKEDFLDDSFSELEQSNDDSDLNNDDATSPNIPSLAGRIRPKKRKSYNQERNQKEKYDKELEAI